LGLTYAAGFRREESTFGTSVNQAVDAVAVGIVAAAIMLLVLNQIQPGDPVDSIFGMIAIQAVPLSIGASVANEIFGRRGEKQRQGESPHAGLKPWQELFSDIGATAIGGVFIGFSIAPTEEVPMIAGELEYIHLIFLVGLTLLISYAIVFVSGFDGHQPEGLFQQPITETTLAYVVSLSIAFVVLYLFDQIELGQPIRHSIELTLVLALPTTIGGAAGRLVI
jgi:putative integral membrane protein (TIGR02587 family)